MAHFWKHYRLWSILWGIMHSSFYMSLRLLTSTSRSSTSSSWAICVIISYMCRHIIAVTVDHCDHCPPGHKPHLTAFIHLLLCTWQLQPKAPSGAGCNLMWHTKIVCVWAIHFNYPLYYTFLNVCWISSYGCDENIHFPCSAPSFKYRCTLLILTLLINALSHSKVMKHHKQVCFNTVVSFVYDVSPSRWESYSYAHMHYVIREHAQPIRHYNYCSLMN